MTTSTRSMDEIRRAGLEALHRELGPVGMIRFLQQFGMGSGDYTAERDQIVGNPSVREILEAIKKREAAEPKERQSS